MDECTETPVQRDRRLQVQRLRDWADEMPPGETNMNLKIDLRQAANEIEELGRLTFYNQPPESTRFDSDVRGEVDKFTPKRKSQFPQPRLQWIGGELVDTEAELTSVPDYLLEWVVVCATAFLITLVICSTIVAVH